MTSHHDPQPRHDGCTCGQPGYTTMLACGHTTWNHGPARPGSYISCYPAAGGGGCQAQRKVITCLAVTP